MPSIQPGRTMIEKKGHARPELFRPFDISRQRIISSKVQLKICKSTGDSQDPKKLTNAPVLQRHNLNWDKLNKYLSRQNLKDITVELTLGALSNLDGIASSESCRNVRRLVLVGDPASFPYDNLAMLKGLLRAALSKLSDLKTIVVRMQPKKEGEGKLDRMICINSIASALRGVRFVRLREIRLEVDEVHDWQHIIAACTSNNRKKPSNRWAIRWNSLQRLHVVGHYSSPKPVCASNAKDTFEQQSVALTEPSRKQVPMVQASLSHAPLGSWIHSVAKLRDGPATVRVDKVVDGDFETHATVYFQHESVSSSKSQPILNSVQGLHKMGVGEVDPDVEESPSWQSAKNILNQECGLRRLKLTLENADADVICNLIERNQQWLRVVWLEVSLAHGTWDQIFVALTKCPQLADITAGPRGLTYSSPNGRIRTGYLKPGCRLPKEVIRYADRHALSSLLATVQNTRQSFCISCSSAEPMLAARSRVQRVEQLSALYKQHKCFVINDISWTGVMIDYACIEDYHTGSRYAARRQSDGAMWQNSRWAGTGRSRTVQDRRSLPAQIQRPSGDADQIGQNVPAGRQQSRQRASWPSADTGLTSQRGSSGGRERRSSARLRARAERRS